MSDERRSYLILVLLALIWGSSFILMHKSMHPVGSDMVMGPFQVGSMRILIASMVLLPIALKHLKLLKTKLFWWFLIVGASGNLIPALLFTLAETRILPSLAGVLNMGTSFFVVLIGIVIYKNKPNRLQIIGLFLGAFGLYQILKTQLHFESNVLLYALMVLFATFCYGISLTTIKFKLHELPSLVITSLSFFSILLPALIIALATNAFEPIFSHPDGPKSLGFLSILSVVGTAFAVFLFTKLVSISSHIFASAVTYLIPVVAVFIGVLAGDQFQLINIIWVIIIIVAVYLMNKKSRIPVNKKV